VDNPRVRALYYGFPGELNIQEMKKSRRKSLKMLVDSKERINE